MVITMSQREPSWDVLEHKICRVMSVYLCFSESPNRLWAVSASLRLQHLAGSPPQSDTALERHDYSAKCMQSKKRAPRTSPCVDIMTLLIFFFVLQEHTHSIHVHIWKWHMAKLMHMSILKVLIVPMIPGNKLAQNLVVWGSHSRIFFTNLQLGLGPLVQTLFRIPRGT